MRQFYLYRIGLLSYLVGFLVIPVLVSQGWSQDQIFIDPLYGTDKVVVNDIYRPGARRVGGTTVNLRYDLYRPATLSGVPILPETLPGMVLVHGGGFLAAAQATAWSPSLSNHRVQLMQFVGDHPFDSNEHCLQPALMECQSDQDYVNQ